MDPEISFFLANLRNCWLVGWLLGLGSFGQARHLGCLVPRGRPKLSSPAPSRTSVVGPQGGKLKVRDQLRVVGNVR